MFSHLTDTQFGLIGGIVGAVLGLAGGAVGTYCSIKNTKGPLERRFMIKTSVTTWIALLVFLSLLIGLPSPWRFLMWIPYGIMLPVGIRHINKRQQEIRAEEAPRPPASH